MAEYLTTEQVARRLGIAPATWRGYVHRGKAPKPDRKLGPLNLWRPSTIDAWVHVRPGQGFRSDRVSPGHEEV